MSACWTGRNKRHYHRDLPVPVPLVDFPVDVLDLHTLRSAMLGQHAVVHLAAIDSSVTAPPELVFDTNVRGTWNVLHAAAEAGVRRVVICSSSSATGLDYTNPQLPRLPAHRRRPSSASVSGLRAQQAARRAHRPGLRKPGRDGSRLRPSWVLFPEAVRRVLGNQRGAVPPASPSTPGRHGQPLPLLRSYVDPADAGSERSGSPSSSPRHRPGSSSSPPPTPRAGAHPPPPRDGVRKPLPRVAKPEIYAGNPHASALRYFPGAGDSRLEPVIRPGPSSPRTSTLLNPPDSSPCGPRGSSRSGRTSAGPETAADRAGKMRPARSRRESPWAISTW